MRVHATADQFQRLSVATSGNVHVVGGSMEVALHHEEDRILLFFQSDKGGIAYPCTLGELEEAVQELRALADERAEEEEKEESGDPGGGDPAEEGGGGTDGPAGGDPAQEEGGGSGGSGTGGGDPLTGN